MERDKEAYCALRHPLTDAVAGTPLDSGYQSRVVDDAVEDLAGWCWLLGSSRPGVGGLGPQREVVAAHCLAILL